MWSKSFICRSPISGEVPSLVLSNEKMLPSIFAAEVRKLLSVDTSWRWFSSLEVYSYCARTSTHTPAVCLQANRETFNHCSWSRRVTKARGGLRGYNRSRIYGAGTAETRRASRRLKNSER